LSVANLNAPIRLREQFNYIRTEPLISILASPTDTWNTISVVGYRDKVSSSVVKEVFADREFIESNKDFTPRHGYMNPTVPSVVRMTRRYDHRRGFKTSPERFVRTFQLLVDMFSPMHGSCVIREAHEVRMRPDGAPGPSYEHGIKRFADVVVECTDDFHDIWENGAQEHFPVYWKTAGKFEILPIAKVILGDCRTFTFADAPFRHMDARLCQDFNDVMNTGCIPWCGVGMSRSGGGFDLLGKWLDFHPHKTMADARQWDASMIAIAFAVILNIRWICLMPRYRTKANWDRLVYIYHQKVHTLIFLPTGQLISKCVGNDSGQGATSNDNTIWHIFTLIHLGVKWCDGIETQVTLENIMNNFRFCTYGDDMIGSHSESVQQWMLKCGGPTCVFTDAYLDFGISTHADEFVCSTSLEGLKFIGGYFRSTQYGWGHGFDVDRAMFAMSYCDQELEPQVRWCKWQSLLALLAFEPERERVRRRMQSYLKLQLGKSEGFDPWIPSDFELYSFWFGWEIAREIPPSLFLSVNVNGGIKESVDKYD